jgi:N-glycosidase YbiA
VAVDRPVIDRFTFYEKGRYVHHVYSNFFIEPDGTCVEIEFQVRKHVGHPWRQAIIRACGSPGKAKRLGRRWKLTKAELRQWEIDRVGVMADFLEKKFTDHDELGRMLLKTGDALMVEGNDWHDTFWGVCEGNCRKGPHKPDGMNCLGELLMDLRTELRDSATTS